VNGNYFYDAYGNCWFDPSGNHDGFSGGQGSRSRDWIPLAVAAFGLAKAVVEHYPEVPRAAARTMSSMFNKAKTAGQAHNSGRKSP
jgi:hypothetical protein